MRTSGVPPPCVSRNSVIRLLPLVVPPEVTLDSIQFMIMFFGRVTGSSAGLTNSTTSTSPFGSV